jgi:hypothetical protein
MNMSPPPSQARRRALGNFEDPKSLRYRWRMRRIEPLLRMIEAVHAECGAVSIIDIGGTERYWRIVPAATLERCNVTVTIINVPGMPLPADHGRFRYAAGDGCALAFVPDGGFDIAHSNSVIEHVGDWVRMQAFSREVRRVARQYFVQTPNYWFPIEPHGMVPLFHWLPRPTRIWLLTKFRLGNWSRASTVDDAMRTIEGARLLNRTMMCALFPASAMHVERVMWLAKSYTAVGVGKQVDAGHA